MESSLIWDLELFLLDPSNKLNEDELNDFRNKFKTFYSSDSNVSFDDFYLKFNLVLDFLTYVKNVDLYKAILSLDKLINRPTFLLETSNSINLYNSNDLYKYIFEGTLEFLNNTAECILNSVVILGASVLFFNVFIRINWLGPPFSVTLGADVTLSEKFKNKAVEDELDNSEVLDESFLKSFDKLDLNDSRSAFLLSKINTEFCNKCIIGSPEFSLIDKELSDDWKNLLKSILLEFSLDGEVIYYGASGIQYLYLSIVLLGVLDSYFQSRNDTLRSIEIWRSRLAYVWQLLVEDSTNTPCPTLYNCTIVNYVNLLKESEVLDSDFTLNMCDPELLDIIKTDFLSQSSTSSSSPSKISHVISNCCVKKLEFDEYLKSFLLLELLQRIPLYNLNRLYNSIHDRISTFLGFKFNFTGKLGIRRKHQKKSIPQLMVDYEKDMSSANHIHKVTNTPLNINLDELYEHNDILESPKLDEDESLKTLSEIEQLFLLSKGFNILATIPQNDQLGLEFLNAISTACLREDSNEYKNWLIYSTSLWLRCKTEYNRTKTVERATLQLHSISDSFYERDPPNRIEYFFGIGFPNRWMIKKEIAKHMFYIGSFSTAFEIYKQLHMWEDAIKCLVICERKNEAKDLIHERLKIMPTPQLYCYLGDVENDLKHYQTAWDLSGGKCSRSARSMGVKYFNTGDFDNAIVHLEKSLLLNPMNEHSQFLLGCCFLKTSNFESALNAFSRVVSLDPESSEAWGNIASCHVNLKNFSSAKIAISQAIKHNTTRWQFWDILLRISISDVQTVCNSVKSLIDLGKKSVIEPWVFAFLVDASSNTTPGVSSLIDDTLKLITANVTENALIWSLYAKYLSFKKDYVGALDSTFKEYRKFEQEILSNLTQKRESVDEQREFDVSQVKKLTNSLSSMVALLKRMDAKSRGEKRSDVVDTLKSIKDRVKSRTDQVNEQFSKEIDLLIESAEVEDIVCVYE